MKRKHRLSITPMTVPNSLYIPTGKARLPKADRKPLTHTTLGHLPYLQTKPHVDWPPKRCQSTPASTVLYRLNKLSAKPLGTLPLRIGDARPRRQGRLHYTAYVPERRTTCYPKTAIQNLTMRACDIRILSVLSSPE